MPSSPARQCKMRIPARSRLPEIKQNTRYFENQLKCSALITSEERRRRRRLRSIKGIGTAIDDFYGDVRFDQIIVIFM